MKIVRKIALALGGIGLMTFAAYTAYRYWHLNYYPRDHRVESSETSDDFDISIGEFIYEK